MGQPNKSKRRKPGRPKGKQPPRKTFPLRLSSKERKRLQAKADQAGISLSALIRRRALRGK